ncbi:MAG: aminotransferase class I/II-fold pyridoxal phosphate-dependent enzyme [Alphaproteobacteria bacterium]|nr:aminotransferase class I/II-fold pyridoxal phosphate-dependent enzyme [Alphaproteobacteria bacterium]
MSIDISAYLPSDGQAAMRRAVTPIMATMQGSKILAIAAQVKTLQAQGREICNLTVGDFSPDQFRVPDALTEKIQQYVAEGQTNYPPADGVPELKSAISDLYRDKLGLDYGPEGVCVGSGARPPIYAAWRLFTKPGDRTVSFLPMWNVGYYAHFCETEHHFVPTSAENNFFPTVEQVEAQLHGTRLLCTNSPLNPTGTVIDRDVLVGIANAVVAENRKREAKGQPPVMWIYDQVYWLLTSQGSTHYNPVTLVPDCAPYVIHVDAISKWMAGTGLRVGWGVLPPYLQAKMKGFIGHVGAWAPRPEQMATAWLLREPGALDEYLDGLRTQINARLEKIYAAVLEMKAKGLPVDAIAPQGAIYLSLKVDLFDHGFSTNEEIRAWMLEEAGVAVVPFQAFDLPADSGWFRMSVGAVGLDELDGALDRLDAALRRRLG